MVRPARPVPRRDRVFKDATVAVDQTGIPAWTARVVDAPNGKNLA